MRALFLLLLLANLLFLAWTRWVAPTGSPTPSSASAVESPLRPIRLRQEVQAAGTAPMGTTPAATDAGIAAASCVSVGPYADQAQADAAAAALQRMGFAARLRTATDEVRVGAWVRVIDLATPADASNAQVALQAAGLAGATVVPDDVSLNVVSVGVYADPQRAAEVADTVTRAGFKPQLSDRLRTMDVFWLDVDRQANGGIPELGDAGPVADSGLPLELRVCPSSPVSVPAPTGPGTAAPTG